MTPIPKENYVCVAQSPNCLVYLSKDINSNISIETVADASVHSKIASNEIELTPVVHITPDNMKASLEKPAIIELLKNVELSDKGARNEIIPVCADSESSEWRDLGPECNCQVLKDRISFEVTHFSLYVVISRKPFPSEVVKPSADSPAPTELTISEFPGFKVQIPPSSVIADGEVTVTATMLYDSPAVCSEDDRSHLASSCIDLQLEPHGVTFSKNVSISIPIPDYAEVMEKNRSAQLQIWHSDVAASKQWKLVDHRLCQDEDGQYVAIVETKHFSTFMAKFRNLVSRLKSPFYSSFNIQARCQVFMSQETVVKSELMFSIALLFYPYKDERDQVPHNFKHMLADSDLLELEVSKHDKIQFGVEFNEPLLPLKCPPIAGLFAINGRRQKQFNVKVDGNVELSGGLPMGELSIGVKGGLEENHQTMALIKVSTLFF